LIYFFVHNIVNEVLLLHGKKNYYRTYNNKMAKEHLLKQLCISLGKNNKPTYAVMAIAAVKGICRPAFTMMDKTEDPETKKYTALREGLTEVIAIPTYYVLGEAAPKLAAKMPKELQTMAKKNLMFLGVCIAAVFAIPALCSIAIKPLTDKIQNNHKKPKSLDVNTLSLMSAPQVTSTGNPVIKPAKLSTFSSAKIMTGMKVGGV